MINQNIKALSSHRVYLSILTSFACSSSVSQRYRRTGEFNELLLESSQMLQVLLTFWGGKSERLCERKSSHSSLAGDLCSLWFTARLFPKRNCPTDVSPATTKKEVFMKTESILGRCVSERYGADLFSAEALFLFLPEVFLDKSCGNDDKRERIMLCDSIDSWSPKPEFRALNKRAGNHENEKKCTVKTLHAWSKCGPDEEILKVGWLLRSCVLSEQH